MPSISNCLGAVGALPALVLLTCSQWSSMNVSATLNAFRVLRSPSLCLPHATVSNFNHLPVPISQAFTALNDGQEPDIRAVVLDKDNCFAIPKDNEIYKPYKVSFIAVSRNLKCV